MNANAYKAQGRSDNDLAMTPMWLIRQLESLTRLTISLDVCCSAETARAPTYFDEDFDALSQSWKTGPLASGLGAAWMNPPFSKATKFVSYASEEARNGAIVIGCVKDAPDVDWYQEFVEREAIVIYKPTSRVNFLKPDGSVFMYLNKRTGKMEKSSANFPICFPIWTPIRTGQPAQIIRFKLDPTFGN